VALAGKCQGFFLLTENWPQRVVILNIKMENAKLQSKNQKGNG